jgi:hypothetical protein
VTTRHVVELGKDDVARALRSLGIKVPKDASIHVNVPGGGDWSNTELEIGQDSQLYIEYTEHSERTEEEES